MQAERESERGGGEKSGEKQSLGVGRGKEKMKGAGRRRNGIGTLIPKERGFVLITKA